MSAAERDCLAEQFRTQYGHREHLYGVLLAEFADDLQAGGVTAQIMAGHLDDPRGNAVHLRLLAGLHRIVLRGDAPELEDFYPSLGGTADPHDAWPLVHRVVTAYAGELHTALDLPPQTNEVGRSAVLAVGLFAAVRRTGIRRIRLLEPGASAGLNLNVDQYRVIGPDWSWGPADSPLVLDTQATGVLPEELEIVERRGCDIAPVDAADPDNARYLTSFVWPWQLERHQRLAAALAIAAEHPVTVDRAPAAAWLADQLAEPADDALTVVWQSITEQYWPASESAAVRQVVAEARGRMPLAHLSMEGVPPTQTSGGYDVSRDGPQVRLNGDFLGRTHHHGPPIALAGQGAHE